MRKYFVSQRIVYTGTLFVRRWYGVLSIDIIMISLNIVETFIVYTPVRAEGKRSEFT